VADCLAVSCTNSDPIAWFGSDPKDQATLASYKDELNKQAAKGVASGALGAGAVAVAPATLVGSVVAGAVVGGGTSATEQLVDTGTRSAVDALRRRLRLLAARLEASAARGAWKADVQGFAAESLRRVSNDLFGVN